MQAAHRDRVLPVRVVASVALAILVASVPAHALSPVNKSLLGGVAIDGYDTVAYFTEGKAVEGSKEFRTTWQGATWRFASAEHRDLFVKDPTRYAPQYGGYCAWAVAHNDTAGIDPKAWTVVDGRLYLNYSLDIQKKWSADVPGNIKKADANWPHLLNP